MTIFRIILLAILLLTGCDDTPAPQAELNTDNRSIATTYKVKTNDDSGQVPCFRIIGTEISQITVLKKGHLVKIVAIEEGLRQFNGELWLQVYPKLTHRSGCYVNINNLIPFS